MTKPLAEGEHVDLDTGTTVKRGTRHENQYLVTTYNPELERDESIFLEDEEIRQIAELAGYEVRD